jgi:hypothetical protein
MTADLLAALALVVLAVHVAVIAFNVFGLIAIPLGGLLDWRFVRVFWWRALHLALPAVPALQALFGRTCFLTLWQAMLEQEVGARAIAGAAHRAPRRERHLLAAADLVLRCALCRDMDLCLGTLVARTARATLPHYLNQPR